MVSSLPVETMSEKKAGNRKEKIKNDDSASEGRITIAMSTRTMADLLVNQGLYDKAMHIYNEMLSSDPENRTLIQRRRELEMLMKIKGRTSEQERK
jgi:pentatricopeptide repeat protein